MRHKLLSSLAVMFGFGGVHLASAADLPMNAPVTPVAFFSYMRIAARISSCLCIRHVTVRISDIAVLSYR